jgi:hypothetical protein
MNRYQLRKARAIAGVLVLAAAKMPFPVPMTMLPQLAARMTHEQWVSVSLAAGVPVADHAAKVLTVALLSNLT